MSHNSSDILDLVKSSTNINNKLKNLKVLKNDLSSDHFPMIFNLTNHGKLYEKNVKIKKQII